MIKKYLYLVLLIIYGCGFNPIYINQNENNFEFSEIILKGDFQKLLVMMQPFIPHITNECYEKFKFEDQLKWPQVNKNYLSDDNSKIIIQVNGKKRSLISTKKDLEENEINNEINKKGLIKKYLDNGKLFKTIYIKNRIINFIIK